MNLATPIDTTTDEEELLSSTVTTEQNELAAIKRKSVSGVVSFFLRTLLLQGIGLGSAFILSAFFSPEDFGIYGFVTQIIGLLVFFSDIGLAAALIQKKDHPSLQDYRTAFTVQQLLSWLIVLVTLGILATGLVQQKVGSVGGWILVSLAVSFPLATLKTISSIKLERQLDFAKLVLPQIAEQLLFHGLLIWMAWRGSGAIAYAYAILARSVIGAVTMFVLQPWQIGFALHQPALKELIGFGAKFQLNDFLARVKDQLFFLVLGSLLPLKEFGYVSWAKNWSLYPYNLTVQNVMAITFPTFSRLQGHQTALKRAIEKSLFFITLTIFPVLVGMSVFIFPLVQLVSKYQKWQPAAWSLVFFSLSIAWSAISTPLTNTLNAVGHINTTLKLMVMWTLLTWVATPLLVWTLGYTGVAVAALIISFTSYFSVYYVQRVIPIKPWEEIWRQLVSALAMGLVGVGGLPWWTQSFVWLGGGMVVTSLVYGGVFMSLGREKLLREITSLRNHVS